MLATKFRCPSCDAGLKLVNAIAPGTRIKCPKCNDQITVPEEDASPATAIRSKAESRAPTRRGATLPADEPTDDYAPQRGRRAVSNRREEDEYDRGDEDDRRDEDDEEVEDRPRRRKKGRKKQPQGSNALLIGLIVGGVVLLLGGFAIAAFVSPGFLLNKDAAKNPDLAKKDDPGGVGKDPKLGGGPQEAVKLPAGTGNENLLAYLPANSTVVLGADVAALFSAANVDLNDKQALERLNKSFKQQSAEFPDEFMQVVAKFDRVVMAGSPSTNSKSVLIVLRAKRSYTSDEITGLFKITTFQTTKNNRRYFQAPETLRGGPAGGGPPQGRPPQGFPQGGGPPQGFPQGGPPQGGPPQGGPQGGPRQGGFPQGPQGGGDHADKLPTFVGMPNDRVLVVGSMSRQDFVAALDGDGVTTRFPADLAAKVRDLQNNTCWMAMALDQKMKDDMVKELPKDYAALAKSINQVKMMAASITGTDQIKVSYSAIFADEATAKAVAAELEGSWTKTGKPALAALALLSGSKELTAFINEFSGSLKISAQGASAEASCQVSKTTLLAAIEAAKQQATKQQKGGFNPGQQGGFGPPPRGGIRRQPIGGFPRR